MARPRHPDRLTETARVDLLDDLYETQVKASFPFELAAYYRLPRWHQAATVIDLGTGNGSYVQRLAREFRSKTFVAVDRDKGLLERARKLRTEPNVQYLHSDISEIRDSFDFVVCRALIQHVPDLEVLRECILRVAGPSSGALLIDRDDDHPIFHWPKLPEFDDLYQAIADRQRAVRGDSGDPVEALAGALRSSRAVHDVRISRFRVPSTIDGILGLYEQQHGMVLRYLQDTGWPKDDLRPVGAALARWSKRTPRFVEMGLKAIEVTFR